MTSWNYRIVDEDGGLCVKEVHYNKGDAPSGATEASFNFGSARELLEDTLMQLSSLTRPSIILDEDEEDLLEGETFLPEITKGDLDYEAIAEMAHNMNLMWCILTGDGTKMPWSTLSDEDKGYCILNVQSIQEDPSITAKSVHDTWCRIKGEQGWVYGPTLDKGAKTHPCLVAFEDLDPIQVAKDEIYQSVVKNLLKYL